MKKILYLLSAVCLAFFVLMAVGCASTQEKSEEMPSEAPAEVSTETDDAAEAAQYDQGEPEEECGDLDALKAEADALREKCLAYRIPEYLPDDWDEAEDAYNRGVEAYGKSYEESEAAFLEAIGKYKEIEAEFFDVAKEAWEAGVQYIKEIKQAAEDAGARGYYPEQFSMAENLEAEALASYNAYNETGSPEDFNNAFDKGTTAESYYTMLLSGMNIRDLRQKIIENNFDSEYPEKYAYAEELYGKAVAAFGIDNDTARKTSSEALAAYEEVCSLGFERMAMEEKARSDEMKGLCDSIKASRSMSSEYKEASGLYASAEEMGASGEWEQSYKTYRDAGLFFAEIYQSVLYKKNVADEAMNAAKERQDASTALALEADRIAPLPEDYVEGEDGAVEAGESGENAEVMDFEVYEDLETGDYTDEMEYVDSDEESVTDYDEAGYESETDSSWSEDMEYNELDTPAEEDGEIESGEISVYEGEEFIVTEDSNESPAEETGAESGREYSVGENSTENAEVTE